MLDFSRVQNYYIYITCGYTDMRKQIDGLAALVQIQFGQRSENRTYVLDDGNQQLSLFDTPEKSATTESSQNPDKKIRVSGHSRKKKRTLEELCATLPVEERIVDQPESAKQFCA